MEIKKVWFDPKYIYIELETGHIIGNPIEWFSRLKNASEQERLQYRIGVNKDSIHWENIDEDLSLESLFDFKNELIYANI